MYRLKKRQTVILNIKSCYFILMFKIWGSRIPLFKLSKSKSRLSAAVPSKSRFKVFLLA